jgi:sigma-B regulation protein RsbU (phosphoserine phosphatase)
MPHSLTTRLIAWGLVITGGVYGATIGLSNRAGRQAAIRAAEREAASDADAEVRAVEDVLEAVEDSVTVLARAVTELQPGPDAVAQLVAGLASDNRYTTAQYAVVQAAPDAEGPPWVREALTRNAPGWSEPYRDGSQAATVIAFAVPLRRDGNVTGAIGASVRLDFLSGVVREVQLGKRGFALVLSRKGLLIAHTRRDLSSAPHDPLAEASPELRAVVEPIVRRAQAGESGLAAVSLDDRTFRVMFRPIARTGWSVATVYDEADLLADVSSLWRTQVLLAASGLVVLAAAIVMTSRRITRPLVSLAESAGRVAMGDLDGPLPEATSQDEVGALTRAFRHMQDSLKEYIRNLQETTAAKERLEGEMTAARRIQADMLPPLTAGGESSGYELSAVLVPARAVGGDLFGHFEENGRLFFLVADVSGKGVPAALFMARAKTLFEAVVAVERDPGAALATINRSLCRQNDAGMYVTAVCGVLDIDTRTVTFAAAGHEPPILVPSEGPSRRLETEGGGVLGLLEIFDYPTSRVTLAAGDALVMYTDGVSEAQDRQGEFFGADRLFAVTSRRFETASALTIGVLREVEAFAAGAPQSDDITILTLKLNG